MYNHNKAQQSKNRVYISWDILYKTHGMNDYVDYFQNWSYHLKLPKTGRIAYGIDVSHLHKQITKYRTD